MKLSPIIYHPVAFMYRKLEISLNELLAMSRNVTFFVVDLYKSLLGFCIWYDIYACLCIMFNAIVSLGFTVKRLCYNIRDRGMYL